MEASSKITKGWNLISDNPHPMTFLEYQAVFCYKGEKKYFKSFNILNGKKVIRKFYLKQMLLVSESLNVRDVIVNTLINEVLSNKISHGKTKSTKKNAKAKVRKPNCEARAKAAFDLFSDLGL